MDKIILSVGHMQFPLGQAQVQRQLLIAKAIILEGFEVTVLCRYGIHRKEDGIEKEGVLEDVHYVYCSGTSVRPNGYLKRNYLKFKGLINEFTYYRKYSKNNQLAGVLVSTNRFHNILFYFLLGRIFRTITVVDNVEYWTSNKNIKGLKWIDKYLYDKYYFHFADRIICISDFLIGKTRGSGRPDIVKIPAITDFDKFRNSHSRLTFSEKFFLFCGSRAYFEIIDFVIGSYELLESNGVFLVLITESNKSITDRIAISCKKDSIRVFSNIPYEDLVHLFLKSEALIIPMRDTDQDKARFPHKISEYCAAGRPIITNSVGEIGNYFNKTNSFLCSGYDRHEYAYAMGKILSEPDQASEIAGNGFQTGVSHFNYKSYSKVLVGLFSRP